MASYTLREPLTVNAVLWTGSNLPEIESMLTAAGANYIPKIELEDPTVLVITDGNRSSRWYVRPGHYVVVNTAGRLSTMDQTDFERLYCEA